MESSRLYGLLLADQRFYDLEPYPVNSMNMGMTSSLYIRFDANQNLGTLRISDHPLPLPISFGLSKQKRMKGRKKKFQYEWGLLPDASPRCLLALNSYLESELDLFLKDLVCASKLVDKKIKRKFFTDHQYLSGLIGDERERAKHEPHQSPIDIWSTYE